jgi:hypothetical protein
MILADITNLQEGDRVMIGAKRGTVAQTTEHYVKVTWACAWKDSRDRGDLLLKTSPLWHFVEKGK